MPTTEEIARLATLRPQVSSAEVTSARNALLRAQREESRLAERHRRCLEYGRTDRRPEDYGYSVGCQAEQAALAQAKQQTASAKTRYESLGARALEQRKASYTADVESPTRFVQAAPGVIVPVRDRPTPAPGPSPAPGERPPPRPPSRLPIAVVGVALLALTAWFAWSR